MYTFKRRVNPEYLGQGAGLEWVVYYDRIPTAGVQQGICHSSSPPQKFSTTKAL